MPTKVEMNEILLEPIKGGGRGKRKATNNTKTKGSSNKSSSKKKGSPKKS